MSKISQHIISTKADLLSLEEFAGRFPLYDACICTIYQIVRDIFVKQDLDGIEILDGKEFGRQEYFIRARQKTSDVMRLMVPFHLDGEVDLEWCVNLIILIFFKVWKVSSTYLFIYLLGFVNRLHYLALNCYKDSTELYICLHTAETTM